MSWVVDVLFSACLEEWGGLLSKLFRGEKGGKLCVIWVRVGHGWGTNSVCLEVGVRLR